MVAIEPAILNQLTALNHWLEEVFGEGMRLSTLLIEAGLSEAEIEQIKTDYLAEFLKGVVRQVGQTTDGTDGERRNTVMIRHYGLLDGEPETLQSIGDSLGLSRERIRQLVKKRLQFYRSPKHKSQFQTALVVLARAMIEAKASDDEVL